MILVTRDISHRTTDFIGELGSAHSFRQNDDEDNDDRKVRLDLQGVQIFLQFPLKHCGGGGDDGRDKNDEGTHHDSTGNIILTTHKDEQIGFRAENKDRRCYCAVLDDPQSSHRTLRKYFVSSGIP